MKVTVKFKCNGLKHVPWGGRTAELNPIVAEKDASEEDKAFFSATPYGKLELTVTKDNLKEYFKLGEDYYITFEPVAEPKELAQITE